MSRKIVPVVRSPGHKRLRKGRGFSLGELKRVGLTFKEALKLGLQIDKRRRSVHEENIEILKKFKSSLDASQGQKSKSNED